MLKQLIICLSLVSIPVANLVVPVLADPIKIAPGSSLQIKIRLLTNKQRPKITTADLAAVQKILGERVTALGLARPNFKADGDNRLIFKIDNIKNAIEAENVRDVLAAVGKLELREQKIGTEGRFSSAVDRLRELKLKRETLPKSTNKTAIAANKNAIAKQQVEISKLFDRAVITNRQITNVTAQPAMSGGGNNILDILSNNRPQPTGR